MGVLTTDKVRWWNDFNRVYYHPRSAIQLNQYQLDTSPFESFTQGRELFHEIDNVHRIKEWANLRRRIFWTGMSALLWKRVIYYKDFRSSWKATLHGQDLAQSTLKP